MSEDKEDPYIRFKYEFTTSREDEAIRMLAQHRLSSAIFDFNEWLRQSIKYTEEKDWPDVEKVKEKLWELIGEHRAEEAIE